MTPSARQVMRDKHKDCDNCDVIKVLDYLDVVEPMAQEINWLGGK